MSDLRYRGADMQTTRACGSSSSSGNNTVITAPGSGKIIVFAYALQAQGTVTAQLTDGNGGTVLSLPWKLQDREGAAPPGLKDGLFTCSATTALVLNLSAAVTVGWEVTYAIIP